MIEKKFGWFGYYCWKWDMDILKLTDKMNINQRADKDIKSQSRLPNVQEAISWGHGKGQCLHALLPLPSTSRLPKPLTSCFLRTSPFLQMTDKRENYEHKCVKSKPQNLHINPVISCSLMKEMFRDKLLTLSLCDIKKKLAFFSCF